MAKQQTKRRRRRYQPGSAYAGDVKPAGVLGFMSSAGMIRIVFIAMALALVAGGGVAIFGSNVFSGGGSGRNPAGFIVPEDEDSDEGSEPGTPPEVRQYSGPPDLTIDPEKRYMATIRTELGDIEVELLPGQAPETVNNFIFLARDGFYDGLIFHYADGSFSANAGDPACTVDAGSSCRGDGGPGYDMVEEVSGAFEKGTLGMANGSQFFIALTGSDQFERFTPFGRIVSGLDVAEQVMAGTGIQTIEILEQ